MTDAPLSRELFAVLSAFVEEHTGLHYRDEDAPLFGDKVRARAREAGFDSLLDYYYFLRYDAGAERERLAFFEALFVHETYFFREPRPLTVAVERFVEAGVSRGRRSRIWSAACSTGEEPLTLAMLLDERGFLPKVDLVASDLSAKTVEHARRGIYGGRALRALADPARQRWFRPREDERVEIDERLRAAVDWRQLNLLDDAALSALGTFDLIFCRNVLIYFSDDTIVRVIQRLAAMLREGGRLCVGASESLLRFGTLLDCEEVGGAFFYLKSKVSP